MTFGSTSTSQVQTDSRLRRILSQERLSSIRPPLAWPLLDMVSLVVQNFSPHRLSKLRHTDSSDTHDLAPRLCGAWVETLPFLACHEMADKVLAPSIKTLATSMVSRGPGGVAPVYDALKAHELAISSIQSGIRSIKGGQSSDSSILAAAVTCLFLAELLLPTSASGAAIHANGVGDLFQMHSPGFYSSGLDHQLFVGIRPVLFIHSILVRREGFLSDPRWIVGPFSLRKETHLQKLMSEVSMLPSILRAADELLERPEDASLPDLLSDDEVVAVIDRFSRQIDIVSMFEETYQDDSPDGSVFPLYPPDRHASISFPSITSANIFTHIWAFHIICARNIGQLLSRFPSAEAKVESRLKQSISEDMILQLSILILRSMDFLTSDDFKLSGAASACLPLIVVIDVLKNEGQGHNKLSVWYERVLNMSMERGYHFLFERLL